MFTALLDCFYLIFLSTSDATKLLITYAPYMLTHICKLGHKPFLNKYLGEPSDPNQLSRFIPFVT